MSVINKSVNNNTSATIDSIQLSLLNGKSVSTYLVNDSTGNISIATGNNVALSSNFSLGIGHLTAVSNQGNYAVALGNECGKYSQGNQCVSVGESCGQTNQGQSGIAIGAFAGQQYQGTTSVAIGSTSGRFNQGVGSIALGAYAGVNNQHANTIIINATGATVDSATTNAFYVAPIRDSAVALTDGSGNANAYPLYYNPTSKEIQSRSTSGSFLYQYCSVSQSIPSGGTGTNVLFPSTSRSFGDTGLSYNNSTGIFTNGTSTSLLSVSFCVGFAANSTGLRNIVFMHSTLGRISNCLINAVSGFETVSSQSVNFTLLSGETFYIYVYQNSGVPLNVGGVITYPTNIFITRSCIS